MIIDVLENLDQVGIGEGCLQGGDCLNEGVPSWPTGTAWRSCDQNRSCVMTMSLEATSLIGILVDAAELTHDGQPDLGVEGDLIPDGDTLEVRRTSIGPAREEEAELVPDLSRIVNRRHLHHVTDVGILATPGGVGDEDNLQVLPKKLLDGGANVATGPGLPLLRGQVGAIDAGETGNDKTVLESKILVIVSEFSIDSSLVLEGTIRSAMILFDRHHAILETTS